MIDEISVIRRENLEKLMQQKGMSKKEFAAKIGINAQTLYNALKPDKPVTERTMEHVYAAFKNLPKDSLNYADADFVEKKNNYLPVASKDIMLTFGFTRPVAIPIPVDEARDLLIKLIEE